MDHLRYSSMTTSDTAITTKRAYYYGAVCYALAVQSNVLIRDGGAGGTVIDSFEVAAGTTETHALEQPIRVTSLYADVDDNTTSCVVLFQEET